MLAGLREHSTSFSEVSSVVAALRPASWVLLAVLKHGIESVHSSQDIVDVQLSRRPFPILDHEPSVTTRATHVKVSIYSP